MVPEQRDSRMTSVLPIYTYMSTHHTHEHTHILYTDVYKNEKSKDLKITFKMRSACNLDGWNMYFVILFLIYWWIYGPMAITSNDRISFKWIHVQYDNNPTNIFIMWTLLFKTTQNASHIPLRLGIPSLQSITKFLFQGTNETITFLVSVPVTKHCDQSILEEGRLPFPVHHCGGEDRNSRQNCGRRLLSGSFSCSHTSSYLASFLIQPPA